MFSAITHWLEGIALSVPLPIFVMVGGVIEEIIAPIPSPLVTTLAGSIASSQGMSWLMLLLICAIATIAKTFGAWIFYVLGVIFKDLAVPRFGKYVGVSERDIARFGAHVSGSRKDILLLFVIRAIPMMPSTPISLACGILNINLHTYLLATFFGFYVRNFIFMVIGYTGLTAMESLMSGINTVETLLKVIIIALVLCVLAWLYWKRRSSNLAEWLGKKKMP